MATFDLTAWREVDRKGALSIDPQPYIVRPPEERKCDFEEAVIGFTPESVMLEAQRCLQCPTPQSCVMACPVPSPRPSPRRRQASPWA